jgi:hypothetical protein
MPQSSTLDIGMGGPTDSIAVTSVANAHDTEVVSLGT